MTPASAPAEGRSSFQPRRASSDGEAARRLAIGVQLAISGARSAGLGKPLSAPRSVNNLATFNCRTYFSVDGQRGTNLETDDSRIVAGAGKQAPSSTRDRTDFSTAVGPACRHGQHDGCVKQPVNVAWSKREHRAELQRRGSPRQNCLFSAGTMCWPAANESESAAREITITVNATRICRRGNAGRIRRSRRANRSASSSDLNGSTWRRLPSVRWIRRLPTAALFQPIWRACSSNTGTCRSLRAALVKPARILSPEPFLWHHDAAKKIVRQQRGRKSSPGALSLPPEAIRMGERRLKVTLNSRLCAASTPRSRTTLLGTSEVSCETGGTF